MIETATYLNRALCLTVLLDLASFCRTAVKSTVLSLLIEYCINVVCWAHHKILSGDITKYCTVYAFQNSSFMDYLMPLIKSLFPPAHWTVPFTVIPGSTIPMICFAIVESGTIGKGNGQMAGRNRNRAGPKN